MMIEAISNWRRIRLMVLERIRKIFGQKEGKKIKLPVLIARIILFPIQEIIWRAQSHVYDWQYDIWEFCGIRYSGDLFRGLGIWRIGEKFEIVQRGDGVITVKRIGGE